MQSARGSRKAAGTANRSPVPKPIDATFITNVPGTDIYFDGVKVGATGENGKLTISTQTGTHVVMASRAGYFIQKRQINVTPGQNSFTFTLTAPTESPAASAAVEGDGTNHMGSTPAANDTGPGVSSSTPSTASDPYTARAEKTRDVVVSGGGLMKNLSASVGRTAKSFSADPRRASSEGDAPEAPAPALSGAESVIERFLDPQQTASVTADDWAQVQSQASAALEQNPGSAHLQAQVSIARGQLAYLRGDYAAALTEFSRVAADQPWKEIAFYGMGNVYLATDQPQQAARAFQNAMRQNHNLAPAYRGLGDALSRLDKHKEAIAYYESAKKLGYETPELSLGLARSLIKREQWNQALKELDGAIKARPSADMYIALGDCYTGARRLMKAVESYREAIKLDASSAEANFKLGEALFDLREYREAKEAFESALALDLKGEKINRQRARKLANEAGAKSKS
jgi:tetratricopeptide (TPR) repeat protein